MKDEKFKNLYQSFIGQIDYCNFIESYGKDFVTLFSLDNIEVMHDFISGNIVDENVLIDDYIENIKVRSLFKNIRNINRV